MELCGAAAVVVADAEVDAAEAVAAMATRGVGEGMTPTVVMEAMEVMTTGAVTVDTEVAGVALRADTEEVVPSGNRAEAMANKAVEVATLDTIPTVKSIYGGRTTLAH